MRYFYITIFDYYKDFFFLVLSYINHIFMFNVLLIELSVKCVFIVFEVKIRFFKK